MYVLYAEHVLFERAKRSRCFFRFAPLVIVMLWRRDVDVEVPRSHPTQPSLLMAYGRPNS